jgi:outer membrane lipoprotein
MHRTTFFLPLVLLILLSGCAHVISDDALLEADPALDMTRVRENPDKYIGATLLLGGLIVDKKLSREGITLEVLSYHLDRWGGVQRVDDMRNRFLARTDYVEEPGRFATGRYITMIGTLLGRKVRMLHGKEYVYPIFAIKEASVRAPLQPRPVYPYYGDWYWWSPSHRNHGFFPYRYDPFWYPYRHYW